MDSVEGENGHEIVIVGGGIGGLATALALHRSIFFYLSSSIYNSYGKTAPSMNNELKLSLSYFLNY